MHGDPVWMRTLLVVHIAAGFGSFLLAPVALAVAKGGKWHNRIGMVYLWSMGIVAATALPMALYRPVLFLALVAIFSYYAAFSGYRVTKLKRLYKDGRAQAVDWVAGVVTFAAGAALALLGWLRPHAVQNMGIVAIIFGVLCMRLAVQQVLHFVRRPKQKMWWWYDHLGNMIGSYIAAWTAFAVTTLPSAFPHAGFGLWLTPTAIGVPAIVAITAYYKRKFTRREQPLQASQAVAA